VKVHIFGITKCLQQCENVGTVKVDITITIITLRDTLLVAQLDEDCTTSRKVAGSIPDGVTSIFH
jgi:hypothetical protein